MNCNELCRYAGYAALLSQKLTLGFLVHHSFHRQNPEPTKDFTRQNQVVPCFLRVIRITRRLRSTWNARDPGPLECGGAIVFHEQTKASWLEQAE